MLLNFERCVTSMKRIGRLNDQSNHELLRCCKFLLLDPMDTVRGGDLMHRQMGVWGMTSTVGEPVHPAGVVLLVRVGQSGVHNLQVAQESVAGEVRISHSPSACSYPCRRGERTDWGLGIPAAPPCLEGRIQGGQWGA
jgi:hypothetical protein